jgi:UDP-N-acetylmuramyl pentapeptide phosphotransferase/UDP-N-acetylglucosamine-1-phosphate transferase
MIFELIIVLSTVLLFLFNFFCTKYSFLLDQKSQSHKSFVSRDRIPLTGGLILIINLIIFGSNFYFSFFFLLIFILGIFSDLNIIIKPSIKFIIQLIITLFFVYISDLYIVVTKIFFIDYFINNKLFSLIFTVFCLLILINGTNFIDGINTLAAGYYLLILSVIIYLSSNNQLNLDFNVFFILLFSLLVIYFFNLFSKTYLGDSGSFLLSFAVGSYLINFCNNNLYSLKPVSPIFVLLLLWYPAFENLFSILRRTINATHLTKADNYHLHQLIFIFIKFKFKKNISINYINSISGNLINFFNLLIFMLASQFYYQTKYLSYLVIINILLYLFFYYILKKKINKKIYSK